MSMATVAMCSANGSLTEYTPNVNPGDPDYDPSDPGQLYKSFIGYLLDADSGLPVPYGDPDTGTSYGYGAQYQVKPTDTLATMQAQFETDLAARTGLALAFTWLG